MIIIRRIVTLDCKVSSQLKGKERPLQSSDIWVDAWIGRPMNMRLWIKELQTGERQAQREEWSWHHQEKEKMACVVRVERVVKSAAVGGDDRERDRRQIRQGLMSTGGGRN